MRGVTRDAYVWGRDLGLSGCDAKTIEGLHVGFLWKVMGKKARRKKYRSWKRVVLDSVIQDSGNQPLHTYIVWRQAAVA